MVKVEQDYHTDAVIEVADYNGVPVLVHEGGRYPHLVNDDGSRIDVYISIARYGRGWTVAAHAGRDSHHQPMALTVAKAETLEGAKAFCQDAISAIAAAPSQYAEARRIAREVGYGTGPLSRDRYEELAREWNFAAEPDEALWPEGMFSFPHYPLADLPRCLINQHRAFGVREERERAEAARLSAARSAEVALIDRLRCRPAARTERRFVLAGCPNEWMQGDQLYSVVARSGARVITDDDPSVLGDHLLGHEGEIGETVTVEIRGL